MIVERFTRVTGLVAVVTGTALTLDGPEAVEAALGWLFTHADLIVIGVAVMGLLHNIAPRGALAGPLILGAAGLTAAVIRGHSLPAMGGWSTVGAGVAVVGGLMVMRRTSQPAQPDPVRRVVAAVFSREIVYEAGQDAPERLSVVAIGCPVDVNLKAAGLPRHRLVEINIVCIAAHVRIAVPANWPVVAGRVAGTRGVRLSGLLDSTETFDDPRDDEQAEDLNDLAVRKMKAARRRRVGSPVVVHIVGWAGSVAIADPKA
jgi:hypothetical protein